MPQQPNNTHADEAYNRAVIRLYRAAISAAERLEALDAKASAQEDPLTNLGTAKAEARTKSA